VSDTAVARTVLSAAPLALSVVDDARSRPTSVEPFARRRSDRTTTRSVTSPTRVSVSHRPPLDYVALHGLGAVAKSRVGGTAPAFLERVMAAGVHNPLTQEMSD
jgi:hypothetical protein